MPKTPRLEPAPEDAAKKHEDEGLDEALDETFPASDPPAATAPGRAGHGETGAEIVKPISVPTR